MVLDPGHGQLVNDFGQEHDYNVTAQKVWASSLSLIPSCSLFLNTSLRLKWKAKANWLFCLKLLSSYQNGLALSD